MKMARTVKEPLQKLLTLARVHPAKSAGLIVAMLAALGLTLPAWVGPVIRQLLEP